MQFHHCILHIGTPKTGTSTLQRYLHKNRSALADQGYFVPTCFGNGEHSHLASYAMDDDRINGPRKRVGATDSKKIAEHREQIEDDLAREISESARNCHTMILSTERCHSSIRRPSEFKRLKSLLGKYCKATTIVVYLRPQHEVAISYYSTMLKEGRSNPPILPDIKHGGIYDYDATLRRWEKQYGHDNIKPRIFDRAELIGQDISADFMAKCGVDTSTHVAVKSRNVALSAKSQAFLIHLNDRIPKYLKTHMNPQRDGIEHLMDRRFNGPGLRPARAEVERFYANFAESNEALRQHWFPEKDALFKFKLDKYPEVADEPDLTVDEAMDIFSALWVAKIKNDRKEFIQEFDPSLGTAIKDAIPQSIS